MNILNPKERIECADSLFVALLEKGIDGVFIVREDESIAYANQRAEELLKLSMEELSTITYSYLLADDRKTEDMDRLHAFFRDKKGFERYETKMVMKGGSLLIVEVSAFGATLEGAPVQCIVVRNLTAYKKMEAEIQENFDRYKDLFDNANDLILNASPEGYLLYTNRAWGKTFGYSPEETANKTIFDMVHPDGREQSIQLLQSIFSGGIIPPSIIIAFVSKAGEKIFLEGDMSVRTINGKAVSVRGIFRNVTKKLTNERRIRELATIVDRSFEAIMITDIQGTIQYVNDSWEHLNGWTTEEVVGKVTPRIMKSNVQDAVFYEEFWKNLSGGNIVERTVINKRKDGTVYQAEIVAMPLKDESGAVTGFAGFQHDVTARNQAQAQLMEAKEFSEEIVENANAIIVITNPKGIVTGFNRKAEEVTGYTKEDIAGKGLFEILVPHEKHPLVFGEVPPMQQGKEIVKSLELPVITKSGDERIIAWTNSDIKKDDKTVTVISFGMDITDQKSMERDMLEKNRELERFKDLMVGRELKMIELKKELDILKHPLAPHAE